MNVAYNRDCLEAMREMPDNAFDLAVVDPPYGDPLGGGGTTASGNGSRGTRFGGMFNRAICGNPTRGGGTKRRHMGCKIR